MVYTHMYVCTQVVVKYIPDLQVLVICFSNCTVISSERCCTMLLFGHSCKVLGLKLAFS